jgi:hypothetical protein
MTSGVWGKRGGPPKPKEGLNGPPKTLIAGVASSVIHLSTRLRESVARVDKGESDPKGRVNLPSGGGFLNEKSVKQICFSPGFEITQLLLPILKDALRVAAGLQGFQYASVGKQGLNFA